MLMLPFEAVQEANAATSSGFTVPFSILRKESLFSLFLASGKVPGLPNVPSAGFGYPRDERSFSFRLLGLRSEAPKDAHGIHSSEL
jgi:hypothetical protein